MTQRTYWASPIGSAPCDTWYSILDSTNIRKESTTIGAKTIIRQKTIRYHHLDDIRVTEIITKESLLRNSSSPRTEGMRRIAEESGFGINTIYRLARLSDVELKEWDIRKTDDDIFSRDMVITSH